MNAKNEIPGSFHFTRFITISSKEKKMGLGIRYRTSGFGWLIFRPDKSTLGLGSKGASQISSALMAEALALREGLLQASNRVRQIEIVASDCKQLKRITCIDLWNHS